MQFPPGGVSDGHVLGAIRGFLTCSPRAGGCEAEGGSVAGGTGPQRLVSGEGDAVVLEVADLVEGAAGVVPVGGLVQRQSGLVGFVDASGVQAAGPPGGGFRGDVQRRGVEGFLYGAADGEPGGDLGWRAGERSPAEQLVGGDVVPGGSGGEVVGVVGPAEERVYVGEIRADPDPGVGGPQPLPVRPIGMPSGWGGPGPGEGPAGVWGTGEDGGDVLAEVAGMVGVAVRPSTQIRTWWSSPQATASRAGRVRLPARAACGSVSTARIPAIALPPSAWAV